MHALGITVTANPTTAALAGLVLQVGALAAKHPHILVATPGRLLDLVDDGSLRDSSGDARGSRSFGSSVILRFSRIHCSSDKISLSLSGLISGLSATSSSIASVWRKASSKRQM